MLRNYLHMTYRRFMRDRVYSSINIAGLAIGMTCCLFIFLFVQDELRYDRYHENADQIYRLRVERYASGGESELSAAASAPMLPAILKDFPQVEAGTRFHQVTALVERGDTRLYEDRFFWADADVFDIFSWPLLSGDAATALASPNTVVLTQSTANRYFGQEEPVGKTLTIEKREVTVTGVIADLPPQSHFTFDMLGSYVTWERIAQGDQGNWWGLRYYTYLKLKEGTSVDDLAAQMRELPSRYVGEQERGSGYRQFLYLQPLTDIHLRSHYQDELDANSDITYVYVFLLVALFILVIAGINFMNLSTARSTQRAREVGIRKVAGAYKRQLALYFVGESVVLAGVSMFLAVVLFYLTMPLFNQLAAKTLSLQDFMTPMWIAGLVLFTLVIGVFSGTYPAFVLAAFQPVETLKGKAVAGAGRVFLRKGLVVFQFVVSVALIIGSLIAFDQMSFMKNKNLGFKKDQILIIDARNNSDVRARYQTLKQNLAQMPEVLGTSMASTLPGRSVSRNENVINHASSPGSDGQTMLCPAVDHDFVDIFGLEVLAGRGFSEDFSTDAAGAYVINEAALRALGWTDPDEAIGQQLTRQFTETRTVVGVVKDFHFHSLQHAIEPMVLRIDADNFNYAALALQTGSTTETIATIEAQWNAFSPGRPMTYFFLDQDYDRQYRSEERIVGILSVFTALAIVVACLGLFGLTSFTTRQRIKEIGVRKVLGASVVDIVTLLARDVLALVVIAVAVAIPLASYGMNRWLETFAYRTDVGIFTFLVSAALALVIACLTVSYQSIRAARANPVDSIKYE